MENLEDLEKRIQILEEAKENGTLYIYPSGMLQAYKEVLPLVRELSMSHTNPLLPTKSEIREEADKFVFETNGHKWSNNDNTAGDNYSSFISGANFVINFKK